MSEQLGFFAPPVPPTIARKAAEKVKFEVEKAAAEDSFNRFWTVYPKRPNHPRDPSHTAWTRALRKATEEEIMAGLARYKFSADPQMRPMAATWLNQKRWTCVDEDLNADPFGLTEFLASLPRTGTLSARAYEADDLRQILVATGWLPTWRGSLDTLNEWMRDGYVPDSVARVIADAVAEFGTRSSLAAFDKRVRFRAERIQAL